MAAEPAPPAADCTFELALPGPLDVAASLEGFRRWGDDCIDRWDGRALVRTLRLADGTATPFMAEDVGTREAPRLRVTLAAPLHAAAVERAVAGLFVQAPAALADLAGRDPLVARLERRYPGVRPVMQPDLFTALVRSISAQQVNLRWAATTRRRLAEAFGTRHVVAGVEVFSLDPARLAAVPPAEIRALQFTTSKSAFVVGVAQAVAAGEVSLDHLRPLPDAEVIARLSTIRGVGRWTAEWLLARTLGRPSVVAGDLGVRKAVGLAYCGGRMPTEAEVRALTAHWGAAAGVAQQLLLHSLSEDRGATLTASE